MGRGVWITSVALGVVVVVVVLLPAAAAQGATVCSSAVNLTSTSQRRDTKGATEPLPLCPDCKLLSCTCTEPQAVISLTNGKYSETSFTVDVGKRAPMVVTFASDQGLGGLCYIRVGTSKFDTFKSLPETVYVSSDTDQTIGAMFVSLPGSPPCKLTITYYVLVEDAVQDVVPIATGATGSGTIMAPQDERFGYRPMTQCLWLLEAPFGSTITLDLHHLDLTTSTTAIHDDQTKTNATIGDFLLLGTGSEVLAGSDVMLAGVGGSRQVVVPFHLAHVFLYADIPTTIATGFTIEFHVTAPPDVTTKAPTNGTEAPTVPPGLDAVYLVVNGADQSTPVEDVLRAVEVMANAYINDTEPDLHPVVTASDVFVVMVAECNELYCHKKCAAFGISINTFDEGDLNAMIANQEARKALGGVLPDCQICDEEAVVVWWQNIVIGIAVVALGLCMILAVWRFSRRTRFDDARQKYEAQQQQRWMDQRRRSSADNSIIGLGGSVASRGSNSSRRFTMPFPKVNRDPDLDTPAEPDMDGYLEYDPDLGRVNPQDFGLQREFMTDPMVMRHYTNTAFEDDEGVTVWSRGPEGRPSEAPDTDSEDSDGGAVSFSSSKRNKANRQLSHAVEVHSSNANETAL